jgi:hypothetical protein
MLTDVTKQLSEAQQVALFTLLTFLEPSERGVDWDEENPAAYDEIELSRLCLQRAWPVDDWNRRVEASNSMIFNEQGQFVKNPNWEAECERQAALLEECRPAERDTK